MKATFKDSYLICSSGIRVAALVVFAIFPGIIAAKTSQLRPLKIQTHFLATSTCIREAWA